MKRVIAPFAAVIAITAVPAHAADLALRPQLQPVAYQPAYSEPALQWDGAYAGIGGGYGWTGARGTLSGLGSEDFGFNGAIATLFAGYNKQLGNVVVGLEADADYSWGKDSVPSGLGIDLDVGSDWSGSLRGRVGYNVGNAMVYVTGGGALANAYFRALGSSLTDTLYGYTVGAGIDYAFTDNVFGRLEYRYTAYPDQDALADVASFAGVDTKLRMHTHAVKAGIGVKF